MIRIVNCVAESSDWNGGWRLLENKGRFSACDASRSKPSLSSGKSASPKILIVTMDLRLISSRPGTAVTRPTENICDNA